MLGGDRAAPRMGLGPAPSARIEYGANTLTLELVAGLDEAVDHIHAHGSGHTEAIITGARLAGHARAHMVDGWSSDIYTQLGAPTAVRAGLLLATLSVPDASLHVTLLPMMQLCLIATHDAAVSISQVQQPSTPRAQPSERET